MIWSDHRVYLQCFANWPRWDVFFPLSVATCGLHTHTQVQLPPHFMVDFGYVEALRPRFCVAKQLKVPHSKMAVRPYQVHTIWGVPAGLLGFGRRVRFIGQKKHMIFMALSLLHQYGDMATALEPHWLEICKMSCQDPCPLGSWLLHCNYYHYWWCHGFA